MYAGEAMSEKRAADAVQAVAQEINKVIVGQEWLFNAYSSVYFPRFLIRFGATATRSRVTGTCCSKASPAWPRH